MADTDRFPQKLRELLGTLEGIQDPEERSLILVSYADRFREVPTHIATRPFPEDHRAPACESEAYVWAEPRPDGTLKFFFAVENPSGISARALAAILDATLSGAPPAEIAAVPDDLAERIFRQNISMGKGMGLMGIVRLVKLLAKEHATEEAGRA